MPILSPPECPDYLQKYHPLPLILICIKFKFAPTYQVAMNLTLHFT